MLSLTAHCGDIITIGRSIIKIDRKNTGNGLQILIEADRTEKILRGYLVEQLIKESGYQFVGQEARVRKYKRLSDGAIVTDFMALKEILRQNLEDKDEGNIESEGGENNDNGE